LVEVSIELDEPDAFAGPKIGRAAQLEVELAA
jgi:hypothetical protein